MTKETEFHPTSPPRKSPQDEHTGDTKTFFTSQRTAGEGSGKETSECPDRGVGCRRKDQLDGDSLVKRIDNRGRYVKRNQPLL